GATPAFTRERSKLTREERIRVAKARRERASMSSGGVGLGIGIGTAEDDGTMDASRVSGRERWGPGGDVVQELKDVIWKVGEKRRRMTEGTQGEGSGSASVDGQLFATPPPPVVEQREEQAQS
ncbi:hypothetical protein EW146_g4961, partial [Bondarzewia mesenterica]